MFKSNHGVPQSENNYAWDRRMIVDTKSVWELSGNCAGLARLGQVHG